MHWPSLVSPVSVIPLHFAALEAAVAATTAVPHVGSAGDAALPAMPVGGRIVAMAVGCEAGSNFTLQVTIDGTADTTVTVTVNSAAEYQVWPSEVTFTKGQTVGVNVIADTTSKDLNIVLFVALDWNED